MGCEKCQIWNMAVNKKGLIPGEGPKVRMQAMGSVRHLFASGPLIPGGASGKESACNAGDPGSIPGSGRSPGGGHSNLPQYSCLENPHGQRSLVSYSPRDHQESDTTEVTENTHIFR